MLYQLLVLNPIGFNFTVLRKFCPEDSYFTPAEDAYSTYRHSHEEAYSSYRHDSHAETATRRITPYEDSQELIVQ